MGTVKRCLKNGHTVKFNFRITIKNSSSARKVVIIKILSRLRNFRYLFCWRSLTHWYAKWLLVHPCMYSIEMFHFFAKKGGKVSTFLHIIFPFFILHLILVVALHYYSRLLSIDRHNCPLPSGTVHTLPSLWPRFAFFLNPGWKRENPPLFMVHPQLVKSSSLLKKKFVSSFLFHCGENVRRISRVLVHQYGEKSSCLFTIHFLIQTTATSMCIATVKAREWQVS